MQCQTWPGPKHLPWLSLSFSLRHVQTMRILLSAPELHEFFIANCRGEAALCLRLIEFRFVEVDAWKCKMRRSSSRDR